MGTFNAGKQTVAINANTAGITGNAVIAAYSGADKTGDILWSWHIWVTEYNPNTPSNGAVYTYNDRTWMDRNLGATSATEGLATTLGVVYQWGRKDPFPSSTSVSTGVEPTLYNASGGNVTLIMTDVVVSNNLANSILNPLTFYIHSSGNMDWYSNGSAFGVDQNSSLWGSVDRTTVTGKTIFDPCPKGWRVPTYNNEKSPWSVFTTTTFIWSNNGRNYNTGSGTTFYPLTFRRYFAAGILFQDSYYWSASSYLSTNGSAIYFNASTINNSNFSRNAYGCSVRCIRE